MPKTNLKSNHNGNSKSNKSKAQSTPPDPDDSDEDVQVIYKQALPVAELPNDFDGIPLDGSQYLAMSNLANESLPFFTRVHNPYRQESPGPEEPAPMDENEASTSNIIIHPVIPTEAWRLVYVAHFMGYRKYIQSRFPPSKKLPIPPDYPQIPQANQRSQWWTFIHGQPRKEVKAEIILSAPAMDEADEEEMMNNPGSSFGNSSSRNANYGVESSRSFSQGASGNDGKSRKGKAISQPSNLDVGEWMDEDTDDHDEEEADNDMFGGDDAPWAEAYYQEDTFDGDDNEDDDGGETETRISNGTKRKRPVRLEPEEERHRPREPLVCLIQHLNSSDIVKILGHFARWITENVENITPPTLLPTQPSNRSPSPSPSLPSEDDAANNENIANPRLTRTRTGPNPFPELYARWIFALLTILSSHLSGQETSVLRDLVRAVAKVVVWRWEGFVVDGSYRSSSVGGSGGGVWRLGNRWKSARDEAGIIGIGMSRVVGDSGDAVELADSGTRKRKSDDRGGTGDIEHPSLSGEKGKYRGVTDLAYEETEVDETTARCWMVIEAVIHGWAQRDLTDEIERLFVGLEW